MSVAPAISTLGYAFAVSPYGPEMLPQPTIANRSGMSGTIRRLRRQLHLDQATHPDHLARRIPVERLVLDAEGARIAGVEERVDAVGDAGDALAVHARDVGSLRL